MTNRIVKVVLRGEIGDLKAKMVAAGKAVGDAADKMTAAGKEGEKFRRGLDDLGGTAGKIGLVAAAGLGAVVVASSNFESAMSNVQAATHETEQNMESLRETALQAGKDTAFSASEAAAGIENLAKAGVTTKEIIGGGLAGALDLAAAGGMGVAEAAEAAAGAMAQFKLDGEDVPHIADLLAAGAGKAQGEVSDMVMALKQAGTVSAQTGLTLEETTGALAAMAEQSLLGSDAGTSFKTMLAALTPNSDAAAAAMEKYNIHAFDAQGNFVGMTELAGQLERGLGKLTDEQRAVTLETIFGSDAVRAAAIIYDNGEAGIRKWITAVDDQGYAAETARIKLDNLKGDVEALGGSIETLLIGMGEGSQGPLRAMVQGATDAVNVFGAMPSALQNTATGMLGITAITGGSLWFGSKVVRGIADTRSALSDLGISSDKAHGKLSKWGSLAARGGGVLAVGMLVGQIADDIGRISSSDVDRALTNFGKGGEPGLIKDVVGDLEYITSWDNTIDLGEVITAGGLFGDSTLDKTAANIELIDQALADLVETGEDAAALDLFRRLIEESGISAEDAAEQFDAYTLAVDNATPNNNVLSRSLGVLGGAWDEAKGKSATAAAATEVAAKKTEEAAEAAKEARDKIREQAEAWGGLDASVGDVDTTLQEFMDSLEDRATALDNFTKNLQWAQKMKLPPGLIQGFIDMGEAGAHQLQNLRNATPEAIAAMIEDWKRLNAEVDQNDRAVANFQERIQELNRKKLEAKRARIETREAIRKIDELIHLLKDIPDVTIKVGWSVLKPPPVPQNLVPGLPGYVGPKVAADGVTVPKDGGPYADRFAYTLAPGEEVISNRYGQADDGRTAAKMINAGQLTDAMLGLADGGTARGYTAGGHASAPAGGGFGMGFTLAELTDALLRARPVNWHGTFEDFQKLERDQARRRAVTGVY